MNEKNKLYTIKEIAELVGISESEIIRMVMLKKLPAIRLGKSIRVREKDLENFLNSFIGEKENIETDSEPTILYTADQVAKILKLSVDNIWNLLKTGELKGFKIRKGRSSWRISKDSIEEFIKNRTEKSIE